MIYNGKNLYCDCEWFFLLEEKAEMIPPLSVDRKRIAYNLIRNKYNQKQITIIN